MEKIPLYLLSEDAYAILLGTGMLWEFYPEATGAYNLDSKKPDILNNWGDFLHAS